MSLKIRLQRHGKIHQPFYHVVAADSRKARDSRYIEKLGYYDPNQEPSLIKIDSERIQHWYKNGAQLSPTVAKLAKINNIELSRKR